MDNESGCAVLALIGVIIFIALVAYSSMFSDCQSFKSVAVKDVPVRCFNELTK